MPFGLSDITIEKIKNVFINSPKIVRVRIFGSRAIGTQRVGSDIDFALEGDRLDLNDLIDLRVALDKLMLPYTVDLVDYERVKNENLGEHIRRVGLLFYQKDSDPDHPFGAKA